MLFILFLCIICVYLYLVRSRGRVSINEPPLLPGALPILGHVHLAYGDTTHFMDFLKRISTESINVGGVLKLNFGSINFYVLTDPVDSLTAVNACLDKSEIYKFGKGLLGEGLITTDDRTSKSHRKLLNPLFTQQALYRFIVVFNERARLFVNNLEDMLEKGPFEYEQDLLSWSLESVCRVIMGVDVGDEKFENKNYLRAIDSVKGIFIKRLPKPWYHNDYIYSWSSLKKEEDRLIRIVRNRCDQVLLKRKRIIKEAIELGEEEPLRPLIDHILMLSTDEKAFTDEEVADEVNNLIAAAYDTTGQTLCNTLMMIGANKEVQDRVYKELNNIFEGTERDIDKGHLSKMVYTEAVIKETLRVYPIVPFYCRRNTTDIKLSKYTLRAGSQVAVSAFGLCRHPVWGADADKFRPERWLDPASLPENHNAFPVFGLGRRTCIGRVFAIMFMKIALAHILRRYAITSHSKNPIFKMEVVMRPATPLLISLHNRH